MDLLFETQSGSTFSIEVGYWDTVLEIKQKIEKYQGVPVSKQTLIFNGKALKDDLDIEKCELFDNSRLQLLLTSPLCKPNQKSTVDIIYGKYLPVTTEDIINDRQDSLVMERRNNSNEQPPPSKSTEQIIKGQDLPRVLQTEQPPPSKSTEQIIKGQDLPRVLQTEQPPPSKSTEQIIKGQDLPRVLQTEKSPPSKSVKEIINIQDSHVKKTKSNKNPTSKAMIKYPYSSTSKAMIRKVKRGGPQSFTVWVVLPYSGESKAATKIMAPVRPRDKVEELRKDLVKMQESGRLSLPQEAYYFMHKQSKLVEDESFVWNEVNHGDTIEISLGSVTSGSVTGGS